MTDLAQVVQDLNGRLLDFLDRVTIASFDASCILAGEEAVAFNALRGVLERGGIPVRRQAVEDLKKNSSVLQAWHLRTTGTFLSY